MPTFKFLTCLGLLGLTSHAWALGNQTRVEQRGERLGAFLSQEPDTRQGTLEVSQSGRASQAYLTQSASQGDRTRVEQGGMGNFSNVTQAAGGAREVSIDQREASQSHAYVYQGHGQRNGMEIVQSGRLNEALVRQGGDDQRLRIEQRGERNGASILIGGDDSHLTLVSQGNDNEVHALLIGDKVELGVEQLGDGHVLDAGLGSAAQVSANQQGAGQYASISQAGAGDSITLRQSGQGNRATIRQ